MALSDIKKSAFDKWTPNDSVMTRVRGWSAHVEQNMNSYEVAVFLCWSDESDATVTLGSGLCYSIAEAKEFIMELINEVQCSAGQAAELAKKVAADENKYFLNMEELNALAEEG